MRMNQFMLNVHQAYHHQHQQVHVHRQQQPQQQPIIIINSNNVLIQIFLPPPIRTINIDR